MRLGGEVSGRMKSADDAAIALTTSAIAFAVALTTSAVAFAAASLAEPAATKPAVAVATASVGG